MRRLLRVVLWSALALVLLAGAGVGVWLYRRPPLPRPPSAAELAALESRRAELQKEFDAILAKDDQGLSEAPPGGILIGMPTLLTDRVVEQVVTGLFGETTLTLRNLKAKVSKDVRAKLVVKKRTIGHIDLDVDIHEVQGKLEPGKPQLKFGRNRIALRLPVKVASGHGRATLHVRWDSKGFANAVCGDVEVNPEVTGTVVPTEYEFSGNFAFSTQGSQVVLLPQFEDLELRIFIKADESSWKVVDQVVAARNPACREALEKVNVRAQLEKVLGKGFKVKLPKKIMKPIRLPAGIEKSLRIQGVDLTLQVKPTGLLITRDRMWYGVDVRARSPLPVVEPVPPPPDSPEAAPVASTGPAPGRLE